MNNLYQVLDGLREFLILSDFTNTVTFGEFSDVDLDKKTNFPLVHMVIRDAIIEESYIEFNIDMMACDIVDVSKEDYPDDRFLGNTNLQDILATQLKVITDAVNFFRRNDLVDNNYITLVDSIQATPFLERFENQLAGWETTITLRSILQSTC